MPNVPNWSRAGHRAVNPASTTFEKEWYAPGTHLFEAGHYKMGQMRNDFQTVEGTDEAVRSAFQSGLLRLFNNRAALLSNKQREKVEASIQTEAERDALNA
jgi:hypothetical protein